MDGPADPQDILRLQGIEALARYIVEKVQVSDDATNEKSDTDCKRFFYYFCHTG